MASPLITFFLDGTFKITTEDRAECSFISISMNNVDQRQSVTHNTLHKTLFVSIRSFKEAQTVVEVTPVAAVKRPALQLHCLFLPGY